MSHSASETTPPLGPIGPPLDDTDAATKKYVDDNAGGGGSQAASFAIVRLNVPATVNSGERIPFDTVQHDTDGYWNAINSQLVIPAGKGGLFLIASAIFADNAAAMTNGLGVLENGGLDPNLQYPLVADGSSWNGSGSCIVRLGEGDTVDLYVSRNGDDTLDVENGSSLAITRLSASS
jgi:hypothetical protein